MLPTIAMGVLLGLLVGLSLLRALTGDHTPLPEVSPKTSRLYSAFKRQLGRRPPTPAEDLYRLRVFAQNVAYIEAVNARNDGYTLGVNEFADMELEEVAAQYFGLGTLGEQHGLGLMERFPEMPVPNAVDLEQRPVDWSKGGRLTPVDRQGVCGACYAFAAVASLEHLHMMKYGSIVKLSSQEVIDCSSSFENNGCKGGWPEHVYKYVMSKGSLARDSRYPYTRKVGECLADQAESRVTLPIKSFKLLEEDKPSAIIHYLQSQTVASGIDMRRLVLYTGGIFKERTSFSVVGHAVLIVGYGEDEDGTKFWKVRNSWGDQWGEQGYFRILREAKDGEESVADITGYNVVPLHFSLE